jgi:hypothetical protein
MNFPTIFSAKLCHFPSNSLFSIADNRILTKQKGFFRFCSDQGLDGLRLFAVRVSFS